MTKALVTTYPGTGFTPDPELTYEYLLPATGLPSDPVAWFDADMLTAADGTKITSWPSLISSHTLVVDGEDGPTLRPLDNHRYLEFDGVNDALRIATLTGAYVDRIEGTGAVLLDTRKTLPGLRALSKYATALGGAANHRLALDDGVLIKDNHIAVAGSVGEATRRAKAAGLENIEVECDTLDQVAEAIEAGADSLLLDNMGPDMLVQAVDICAGRVMLEASGGVNLATIRAIAETGVDSISVGALTQAAPAVDIGLDLAD